MDKQVNYLGIVVGPPQFGKSTLALSIVRDWLEGGGWVLAHDPLGQYRACCRVYEDADGWRAAAREASTKREAMARGASLGGDASAVVALAVELGKRWNTADNVRMRMLVVFDEGSLLDNSGGTWIGKDDNRLIATRRHLGIGLLYLVQRKAQLMQAFWDLSTDVYAFAQQAEDAAELERVGHLPRGTLGAVLPAMPKHQFIHLRPGEGVV